MNTLILLILILGFTSMAQTGPQVPLKPEVCAEHVRNATFIIDAFYRDGLVRFESLSMANKILNNPNAFTAVGGGMGAIAGVMKERAAARKELAQAIVNNTRFIENRLANLRQTLAQAQDRHRAAVESGDEVDAFHWEKEIARSQSEIRDQMRELHLSKSGAYPETVRISGKPRYVIKGLRGSMRGAAIAIALLIGIKATDIAKMRHDCRVDTNILQSKELFEFLDIGLLTKGCHLTREGMKVLLDPQTDVKALCERIPQMDQFAENLLIQHFAEIESFAAPTETERLCNGDKPSKISFKVKETLSTMFFENSGENEYRYVINVKNGDSTLRYVIDTDKDQKSMHAVTSAGVYTSNDFPSLEANKLVLYYLDNQSSPPTDSIVKRRWRVAESIFYAQAAWAKAGDECKEQPNKKTSHDSNIVQ